MNQDERQTSVPDASAPMQIEQAAKYLGISRWTLYRLCGRNIVPYYKPSRILYFRREELDRWVNQNRNTPAYELAEQARHASKGGQK